jgi:hypothetical protein
MGFFDADGGRQQEIPTAVTGGGLRPSGEEVAAEEVGRGWWRDVLVELSYVGGLN